MDKRKDNAAGKPETTSGRGRGSNSARAKGPSTSIIQTAGGWGRGRTGKRRDNRIPLKEEEMVATFGRKLNTSKVNSEIAEVILQGFTTASPPSQPKRSGGQSKSSRKRKPKNMESVTLSSKNESMIVNLLRNLDSNDGSEDEEEFDPEEFNANVDRLVKLGFAEKHAIIALKESGNNVDAAIEWLCLNLDNSELPKAFAPAQPVKVTFIAAGGSTDKSDPTSFAWREAARSLATYGFKDSDIKLALEHNGGDKLFALYELLEMYYPESAFDETSINANEEGFWDQLQEQREDERTALASILSEGEYFFDSPELIRTKISLGESKGSAMLEFHIPPGSYYPLHPPLVSIKAESQPPELVLKLIRMTIEELQNYIGAPAIYAITAWAQSTLPGEVESYHQARSRPQQKPVEQESPPPKPTSYFHRTLERLAEQEAKAEAEEQERAERIAQLKRMTESASDAMASAVSVGVTVKDDEQYDEEDSVMVVIQDQCVFNSSYEPRELTEEEQDRIMKLNGSLYDRLEEMKNDSHYQQMLEQRKKLPAYKMKDIMIETVNKNQVVLISGATGSGKTTQVAQLILDDAIEQGRGGTCNIICTQPRRISAIGVAKRVADERSEVVGQTVGYSIRLETVKSPDTRLMFVTTGVLLRRLQNDPWLVGVSHVILDEVHERDINTDFLLIILRQIVKKRKDLKVILMSATLNADSFVKYFSQNTKSIPRIDIPGTTFDVKTFFLEDAIECTKFFLRENSKYARPPSSITPSRIRVISQKFSEYSRQTQKVLTNMDITKLNFDLIELLVVHICETYDDGGILIFLPGIQEISTLYKKLTKNPKLSQCLILPVHSTLASDQQQQIFNRPPSGMRKVVLSTNIAETSITIDDIVFVIDSCKVRETRYDPDKKMVSLDETWVSKASAQQRRGRAGRVKEGICWHLVTKYRMEKLAAYQVPEMKRTPLDELILQIKLLKLGPVKEFLSQAMDPPDLNFITQSIENLKEIGALDHKEQLTPLGYHLAQLPVPAHIGKMLLFGAMFKCLSPFLTVGAVLTTRSPFAASLEERADMETVKRSWDAGTHSDHYMMLRAIEAWEEAKRQGWEEESEFCKKNYLSISALNTIKETERHLRKLLKDIGFIHDNAFDDENAGNLKLFRAILCAGLYPNIARIDCVYNPTGSVAKVRFFTRREQVYIHPSSVNHNTKHFESKWLLFHEKVKTTKVYLRDSTMVTVYPLLLFGGKIAVDHEKQEIIIDNWIRFAAPGKIGILMLKLRKELDRLLMKKISDPSVDIANEKVIQSIIQLLKSEPL